MTCYQRHIGWMFEALDLPFEKRERRLLDEALREVLGVPEGAHCPEVWAAIKALDEDERAMLSGQVSEVLKGQLD